MKKEEEPGSGGGGGVRPEGRPAGAHRRHSQGHQGLIFPDIPLHR